MGCTYLASVTTYLLCNNYQKFAWKVYFCNKTQCSGPVRLRTPSQQVLSSELCLAAGHNSGFNATDEPLHGCGWPA